MRGRLALPLALAAMLTLCPGSAFTDPLPRKASTGAPLVACLLDTKSDGQRIPISNDGLYYIDAIAQDHPLRLLIDSGANMTLLTRADARRLGIAVDRLAYRHRLRTAKEEVALALTRLTTMTVAGNTYTNVRVAVARGDGGVSLLGQDMIRHFHLTIDKGVMTLASVPFADGRWQESACKAALFSAYCSDVERYRGAIADPDGPCYFLMKKRR